LHHHLNYNVTLIEFTDNLINGSLAEFKKLNQLLVKAQDQYPSLKQLRYKGDFICRPRNQFTETDFQLMKQAGCEDLIVGIESFSEPIRYHMGKKFSNEDIDFHLPTAIITLVVVVLVYFAVVGVMKTFKGGGE
jgi:radical SAM superfamily enzyme YgiQ (UPF0313 family)